MNEDFVPFELAKKLNEKGFNEKCMAHYYCALGLFEYNIKDISFRKKLLATDFMHSYNESKKGNKYIDAPTISQVLKWLREDKRIDSGAVWDNRDGKWVGYINEMDMPDLVGEYVLPDTHDAYEAATIACIEYVLDNLI